MSRLNEEVAAAFEEVADLTEMAEGDRFRVLAYRRVAATLRGEALDIARLDEKGLRGLRGVGKATAEKISEFLSKGTMQALEDARAAVPQELLELKRLPGLGPRKAMQLHRELGVRTLEELREAAERREVRPLKGMGPKTEENLLRALERPRGPNRRLLADALEVADEILGELRAHPAVRRASAAGSLRRMRETIGDVDLLVASEDPEAVADAFTRLTAVERVSARGATKSSIVTSKGVPVDLRVVALDEFGAALQYFTGSKEHNVKVREHAVRLGLKLSEYGLFRVKGGERKAGAEEEEVYEALGMQTPPPAMREDRGEVELALKRELPSVVELGDIAGDLHSHTIDSDGITDIEGMAEAARSRGYSYLAITDHAGSRWRMDEGTISAQRAEIDTLNRRYQGSFHLLHGVEVDVRPDGRLDLPDEVLSRFDLVIASVHDGRGQGIDAVTERMITAIRHPSVNIFGHPSSRRIGKRPPNEFDAEAVFRAAAEEGVALEVNATPDRLDLSDDHVFLARNLGTLFVIDTDAHGPAHLDRLRLGVATAQRGWAQRSHVVNTRTLEELRRFLGGEA
jgi:DNA polymerase (family 10)